jgi:hypothetical protein
MVNFSGWLTEPQIVVTLSQQLSWSHITRIGRGM